MAARHGAVLAELAELTLSGARRVSARLEEAETSAEVAELSLALSRVGRSVRQILLLETKLVRDRRTIAREVAGEAKAADDAAAKTAREARKSQVRVAVGRIAHEAIESIEEADAVVHDIEDLLDDYVRAFEGEPVETLIEAICKDFRIEPAEAVTPVVEPLPPAKPAVQPPASDGPRLVQMPDGGWAPEPDSS